MCINVLRVLFFGVFHMRTKPKTGWYIASNCIIWMHCSETYCFFLLLLLFLLCFRSHTYRTNGNAALANKRRASCSHPVYVLVSVYVHIFIYSEQIFYGVFKEIVNWCIFQLNADELQFYGAFATLFFLLKKKNCIQIYFDDDDTNNANNDDNRKEK